MSDTAPPPPPGPPPSSPPPRYPPPPPGPQPGEYVGQQRKPWKTILLGIVTLGIYSVWWTYRNHEDIKLHSGEGVGGVVGLVIALVVGLVTLFLLPVEIKRMYEMEGKTSPVSAKTAAWILLFFFPWTIKVQKALNQHWADHGAPPPA